MDQNILKNTYENLKKKYDSELNLESFDIVKTVIDYRNYWRPKKVKTLLLDESHVYTTDENHKHKIKHKIIDKLKDYPDNYVRFVYCLGYGENNLANLHGKTWQFWRLFASCMNRNCISGSKKISIGSNTDFENRLQNKIRLLKKLRDNGIWLMDASIIALYMDSKKPHPKTVNGIIKICWDQYVSLVIDEIKPEKIIVVGRSVFRVLKNDLNNLGIPYYVEDQPKRLSQEKWLEYGKRIYELCNN